MPELNKVHVIVLTLNEELHLARCLESLKGLSCSITVVDSGSTDKTVEIATSFGADVVTHPWVNYATQMNFAIEHVRDRGGWLLRMDADEYLCDRAADEISALIDGLSPDVSGVHLRLRRVFMGRWLRHGGLYPIWLLRLWRNGRGRCENRWMDEYIQVDGAAIYAPIDFADHSLKPIAWWSQKHVGYAGREAIDILLRRHVGATTPAMSKGMKRWIKANVYYRFPGGLRSFLYFVVRYIFRLGFLDGRPGYYFHLLQALWYRTLVDAIVDEIQSDMSRGVEIGEAILKHTGHRLDLRPGGQVEG